VSVTLENKDLHQKEKPFLLNKVTPTTRRKRALIYEFVTIDLIEALAQKQNLNDVFIII